MNVSIIFVFVNYHVLSFSNQWAIALPSMYLPLGLLLSAPMHPNHLPLEYDGATALSLLETLENAVSIVKVIFLSCFACWCDLEKKKVENHKLNYKYPKVLVTFERDLVQNTSSLAMMLGVQINLTHWSTINFATQKSWTHLMILFVVYIISSLS